MHGGRSTVTMSTSAALLLILGFCAGAHALKLPSYIKACSRNDPNINDCAKKSATEAIPHFINGDPKYRIPPLEPIIINELSVKKGSNNFGMEFIATNAEMRGLKDTVIREIRLDLKKQHIEYDLLFPEVNITSRYNISGRVLVLPITGDGIAEINLKNVSCVIAYDFVKKLNPELKQEVLIPSKSTLTFNAMAMKIHLSNLFNGDKFLGDNMNHFLNENWQELIREMGPPVGEAINQFVSALLSNVFELVPYDDAFLDV
ncbi:protein takeout-like [Periplaneta americana]|uniref:protein takeout-like n=1 Tax=Periplaneta americana TaxID=6978 RepID=UPI0037E82597